MRAGQPNKADQPPTLVGFVPSSAVPPLRLRKPSLTNGVTEVFSTTVAVAIPRLTHSRGNGRHGALHFSAAKAVMT